MKYPFSMRCTHVLSKRCLSYVETERRRQHAPAKPQKADNKNAPLDWFSETNFNRCIIRTMHMYYSKVFENEKRSHDHFEQHVRSLPISVKSKIAASWSIGLRFPERTWSKLSILSPTTQKRRWRPAHLAFYTGTEQEITSRKGSAVPILPVTSSRKLRSTKPYESSKNVFKNDVWNRYRNNISRISLP